MQQSSPKLSLQLFNFQAITIATAIWPLIFFPVCMILYFIFDANNYDTSFDVRQIPTLSKSGSDNPSFVIFNYGLHLEAILAALVFSAIYVVYKEKINNYFQSKNSNPSDEVVETTFSSCIFNIISCGPIVCATRRDKYELIDVLRWNKIIFGCGLLGAFFMALVGSISPALDDSVHGAFAAFMFFFGILHMVFFYFHIARVICPEVIKEYFLVQCALFCILPFNLLLIILASITYGSCSSLACRSFAADISPAMEFWTAIWFLIYVLRFHRDLRPVALQVSSPSHSLSQPLVNEEGAGSSSMV